MKINIYLNGLNYPMTIERQDEEDVRAAAQRVNETIDKARKFLGAERLTENRLLAIVSYQLALSAIRSEREGNPTRFTGKIKEWDSLLEEKILSDYTDNISISNNKSKNG